MSTSDHHDHGHGHQPGHGHAHGHQHGHQHGDDFDWEAMADSVELDGMMIVPLVADIMRDLSAILHWSQVRHVIDAGAGPGVIAAELATHAARAKVTALDSSPPMLARATARAAADRRLAGRVRTVVADLDHDLPRMRPAEVIVASMVLHHVADPVATLTRLYQQMVPGGVLVVIEFGGPPAVLPPDDPMLLDGAWTRLEAASAKVIRQRLGLDPWALDWPSLLGRAGFTEVTQRTRAAFHDAPLPAEGRRWISTHINRGLSMVGDQLRPADLAPLQDLADSAAYRRDLFVRAERRVLIARRPLPTANADTGR